MKRLALPAFCSLVFAATCDAADLVIVYNHAGLTDVKVTERKQLHFGWHTRRLSFEKGDSSPMRQSLEAYDSHSAVIWLTKAELSRFRQWVEQNGILDLKSKYPEPEQKTYGSAFHSSLTVELDGRKHALSWTGDTQVPDALNEAVQKLVQMCHEVRQRRERR